jgi:hypothetical protein
MKLHLTLNRQRVWIGFGTTAVGAVGAVALAAACAKSTGGDNGFSTQTTTVLPDGAVVTQQPMFSNDDSGFQATQNSGCASDVCNDFPSDPIIDQPDGGGSSVPSNVASSFGDPGSGASSGGPCIYERAPGALFPNNWLRPRFYWSGGSGKQVYELRFASSHEQNPLVVYTTQTKWTMPKDIWTNLANDLQGQPITVDIRELSSSGQPQAGTSTSFVIAPAPAQGAMVFWATNSFDTTATSTALSGFQVGDETTATVLTPPQVQQKVWAQPPDGGAFPSNKTVENVGCIGCHTSTPDGNYVGFTAQWPWPNAIASVQADAGRVGSTPSWLGTGALANLSPNVNDYNYAGGSTIQSNNNVDDVELGIQTFSQAHYKMGDRVEITSIGSSADNPQDSSGKSLGVQAACQSGTMSCVTSQLIWLDLEWNGNADAGLPSAAPGTTPNAGWGYLTRTGDNRSAGAPAWSHDGKTVAYTSSDKGTQDGHMRTIPGTSPNADLMTIPYTAKATGAGGAGGAASKVQGAADSTYNEYYPAFAPDDTLLAFNRVAVTDDMYSNPKTEVFVIPESGGTAQRIVANDPAACVGMSSPGVANDWPKWAPAPAGGVMPASDGKLYYWLTFSSVRVSDKNNPASSGKAQLYIAGVSVDPNNGNAITTYPAVYLWNQDPTYNNMIPAWDNFTIPKATGGPPR